MDEIEWWEFDTVEEMAAQAAGDIGFVVESAIEAHGGARIALPGGAGARPLYAALLGHKAIDWSKVTLLPTDDRLVRLDDALSNHDKLRRLFEPRGATVVSLVDEAALGDYREAGRLADERLKLIDWPLDLVVLGVGADGHTASLLPGPDLDRALTGPRERRAVGVRPDPMPAEAAVERVTLTAAALTSARAIMLALEGAEQRAAVERAIKDGPLSSLPIGRLLAEVETAIDIFWSA